MSESNMRIPRAVLLLFLALPVADLAGQTPVLVAHPIRTTVRQESGLPGALIPEERLELRARITGYLGEIPVDHGTEVRQGDLLARLDVPDLDARVAQAAAALAEADAAVADAEAALELAHARVDEARGGVAVCAADIALAEVQARRTRSLVEKQGATPQELDEAQGRLAMANARGQMADAALATATAAVQAAQASVKSAEARRGSRAAEHLEARTMLGFARLDCPLDRAVVTWRRLDPGALVRRDDTVILELQRVDKLRAEFHVPERDAVRVRAGTPVDLRFDALADEPVQAVISRLTRSITSAKKMVVQVDLDNGKGRLLPGMFVYATLLLQSADGVLTLPSRSIHTDAGGTHYVLVAADGVTKKVPVVTSTDNGIRVQVDAGLDGDEQVIVAGDVNAGDPVRAMEGSK